MQTLPFVPINLHRCWPREWKHSLRRRCLLIAENTYLHILQNTSCQEHSQGRRSAHPLHPPPRSIPGVRALGKRNIGENGVCQSTGQKNKGKGEGARYCYSRCVFRVSPATRTLAWVSGVSGGKGERWKRKRERAEGEKRLTQMLLLEPSTPTQHDSIPSNQNHIRSLGCQLHVSKSLPKINLTIRSGRAGACVATISLFLKPPMRSFRILVTENLPFLNMFYNMF